MGWVFLSTSDTLKRENDRVRTINRQLKEKYKSQRSSLPGFKEALTFCIWRGDCTEKQTQNLILRVGELQKKVEFSVLAKLLCYRQNFNKEEVDLGDLNWKYLSRCT